MREIKYRAWDKKDKLWVDHNQHLDETKVRASVNPPSILEINHPDWIFMQYTGLKDKNGVEIYEGDVVRYYGGSNSWVVTFGEYKRQNYMNGDNQVSHLGFYGRPIPNYDKESNNDWNGKIVTLLADDFCNGKEVIGNLYENPELLDKD